MVGGVGSAQADPATAPEAARSPAHRATSPRKGHAMNDLAREWVAALRSGRYTQAKYHLVSNAGSDTNARHCCLGVLSDVCVKTKRVPKGLRFIGGVWESAIAGRMFRVPRRQRGANGFNKFVGQLQAREQGLLPERVLRQVGLTPAQEATLVRMNDAGDDFWRIADKIEGFLK